MTDQDGRLKILQLISSAGHYGAENMLVSLASRLNQMDCDCTVGVFQNLHRPNTEIAKVATRLGVSVEVFPCNGRADRQAIRRIRAYLRGGAFDVLHTHGYKANLYGYLAAAPLPVSLVATCHNWSKCSTSLRAYALLDHAVLRRYHKIVTVSESVASSLRRFRIPQRRLVTINNGIEISSFESAEPSLGNEIQNGARTVVGMVGRLIPAKGAEYFLRAAQGILESFPSTLFVLVGDGPFRSGLEALAHDLGIERNVVFTGQRGDMPGVYASLDIFVLPSLSEGMPLSILEAMAARRPVVATRVGSIPTVVISGQTGLLVEPRDVPALRDSVLRLIEDSSLRQKLSDEGQRLVAKGFSAEAMASRYFSLYQSLVVDRHLAA
jgi:glycosyltransferase involved in cell wall biosynthesis